MGCAYLYYCSHWFYTVRREESGNEAPMGARNSNPHSWCFFGITSILIAARTIYSQTKNHVVLKVNSCTCILVITYKLMGIPNVQGNLSIWNACGLVFHFP